VSAARVLRLATWSGPRNISTALMRAWGSRPDTVVWDEPFYAHYLESTGIDHPMRAEVVAAGETDWRRVVDRLVGPLLPGKRVFYQKHMAHHLLPHIDRTWLSAVDNAFLIRAPEQVALSYRKARAEVRADDLGYRLQAEIFERLANLAGEPPVVIDAADFLRAPERMLRLWCDRLALDFDPRMLSWAPGPRASDGVWGRHWYANLWRSTGFEPFRPSEEALPGSLRPVVEECRPYYEALHRHRLRV